MIKNTWLQANFPVPHQTLRNEHAEMQLADDQWMLSCTSGYEVFLFEKPASSFIWEGKLHLEGLGKFGLVLDADSEGNGYFIPFDFVNGYVAIRSWGFNPNDNKQNFIFTGIQANLFAHNVRSIHFKLIRYGNYIELSVDGIVKLTLIDYTFTGERIGMYSASSKIALENSTISQLPDPVSEYASQENVVVEQS